MTDGRDLAARLGIFARTFPRDAPGEVAAAVSATGYKLAHWNFAAIGRQTLAGDIPDSDFARVRADFNAAGADVVTLRTGTHDPNTMGVEDDVSRDWR